MPFDLVGLWYARHFAKGTAAAPGFRVAVRLRAVTPGEFELPGAEVSDMYRPGVFARQATARIKVLTAE